MKTVGVLCVHGIGDQRQGATLNACVEPQLEWLEQWLKQRGGDVSIKSAALTATQLKQLVPAHTCLEIQPDTRNGNENVKWLFAESWWAADFSAPPFAKLAGWLLTKGSAVIISHVAELGGVSWGLYPRKGSRARAGIGSHWLVKLLRFLLALCVHSIAITGALMAVFFFQLAVIFLMVFSWIPIASLRKVIRSILATLQGTLGDSQVFTGSPVVRASVINHVRNNLAWLEKQCDAVVVLAHSQGAAVAYHALLEHTSEKVRTFVTYGSGLLKLSELQALDAPGWRKGLLQVFRYTTLVIPIYIISVPTLWEIYSRRVLELGAVWRRFFTTFHFDWSAFSSRAEDLAVFGVLLPPLIAILAYADVYFRYDDYRAALREQTKKLTERFKNFQWLDVFASHDPVPNGSMFDDETVEGYDAWRVVNRMSFLRDHTTYWENADEFVPLVLQELNKVSEAGLFKQDDEKRIEAAASARHKRLGWLAWYRRIVFLSVAIPLIVRWHRVMDFGRTEVASRLPHYLTSRWAAVQTAAGLNTLAPASWQAFVWQSAQDFVFWMMGAAGIMLLGFLWYQLIYAIGNSWSRGKVSDLLNPKDEGAPYILRPIVLVILTLVPIHAAIRWMWFGSYQLIFQDFRTIGQTIEKVNDALNRWLPRLVLFALGVIVLIIVYFAVADWWRKVRGKKPEEEPAGPNDGSTQGSQSPDS
jgi:pimeloyl-ACP methyl ester carboxylesterase